MHDYNKRPSSSIFQLLTAIAMKMSATITTITTTTISTIKQSTGIVLMSASASQLSSTVTTALASATTTPTVAAIVAAPIKVQHSKCSGMHSYKISSVATNIIKKANIINIMPTIITTKTAAAITSTTKNKIPKPTTTTTTTATTTTKNTKLLKVASAEKITTTTTTTAAAAAAASAAAIAAAIILSLSSLNFNNILFNNNKKLLWFVLLFGFMTMNVNALNEETSSLTSSSLSAAVLSGNINSRRDIYIDDEEDIEGSGLGGPHDDLEKDHEFSGSGFGPDDEDSDDEYNHRRQHTHTQQTGKSNINKQQIDDNDFILTSRNNPNNENNVNNLNHNNLNNNNNNDNNNNNQYQPAITHQTSNSGTIIGSGNTATGTTGLNSGGGGGVGDIGIGIGIGIGVGGADNSGTTGLNTLAGGGITNQGNLNNINNNIHELGTNSINSLPPESTNTDKTVGNEVLIMNAGSDDRTASFFAQPGILAAVIGGSVVGLLFAILIVMFIVYRMRKKDEGSYALDEPKRSPAVNSYGKNATNREFYA